MNKAYPGVLLAGLFLAFGAGCKGTLVPVFALFFLCFGIWMLFFKHWSDVIPNFWSLFFCILICIVFLGRHAANLFVFGNPLQRVPLEAETGFDVANILPAITNQFRYMVGVSPDKPWLMGFRFAETRDFAATGWLLSLSLLAITIWVVRHPYTIGQVKFMKHWRGEISAPFLGFTLGLPVVWIYLSGMMPILKFPDWANFQLRFFLWYLVPMAVCVFVFMLSSLKGKKEILWLIGMIVAVFLNLRFGFQPSDVFYSESGLSNFRAWIHRSDFDKKLAGPHFIKNDLGPLQIKAGDPQKILLVMFSGPYAQYNGNPPIFPFFGQDLEWTVDFAGTGAQFKEKLKAGNYDWVVFSQDRDAPLQENLDEELEGTDYERMHAGRWAQIYGKRNECP
jgi:hypothetical protein